ncbi:MAG: hypothetical protein AB7E32_14040 [Desulfovibrio sp.]
MPQNITIRGTSLVKRGICPVCCEAVLEAVNNQPCGQQTVGTSFECSGCGMSGAAYLWECAWGLERILNERAALKEKK